MSTIHALNEVVNIDPNTALELSKNKYKSVLILGYYEDDGWGFYASNLINADALWLVERYKATLLGDRNAT